MSRSGVVFIVVGVVIAIGILIAGLATVIYDGGEQHRLSIEAKHRCNTAGETLRTFRARAKKELCPQPSVPCAGFERYLMDQVIEACGKMP